MEEKKQNRKKKFDEDVNSTEMATSTKGGRTCVSENMTSQSETSET